MTGCSAARGRDRRDSETGSPRAANADAQRAQEQASLDRQASLEQAALVDGCSIWGAFFLIILPIVSSIEKPEPLPFSITESVLGKDESAVLNANPAAA